MSVSAVSVFFVASKRTSLYHETRENDMASTHAHQIWAGAELG